MGGGLLLSICVLLVSACSVCVFVIVGVSCIRQSARLNLLLAGMFVFMVFIVFSLLFGVCVLLVSACSVCVFAIVGVSFIRQCARMPIPVVMKIDGRESERKAVLLRTVIILVPFSSLSSALLLAADYAAVVGGLSFLDLPGCWMVSNALLHGVCPPRLGRVSALCSFLAVRPYFAVLFAIGIPCPSVTMFNGCTVLSQTTVTIQLFSSIETDWKCFESQALYLQREAGVGERISNGVLSLMKEEREGRISVKLLPISATSFVAYYLFHSFVHYLPLSLPLL